MSADLEPIPLSALQHWHCCPRQCGLIHLDQAFDDNVHTLRGQAVHSRVDKPGVETANGVRVERAPPLWHDAVGLVGKSDVVEFSPAGTPYPVEYKHGSRHKAADIAACDDIQLAAQAMCLQVMIGRTVAVGAIVYATSKRRRVVPATAQLRAQVEETAQVIRQMLAAARLPPPLGVEHAAKALPARSWASEFDGCPCQAVRPGSVMRVCMGPLASSLPRCQHSNRQSCWKEQMEMAVVFKDIEAQALALPERERSALVARLLDRLDGVFDDPPEAVARAWDEELGRRVAEFESGRGQDIPVEQVQAELQAILDHGRA